MHLEEASQIKGSGFKKAINTEFNGELIVVLFSFLAREWSRRCAKSCTLCSARWCSGSSPLYRSHHPKLKCLRHLSSVDTSKPFANPRHCFLKIFQNLRVDRPTPIHFARLASMPRGKYKARLRDADGQPSPASLIKRTKRHKG